MANEAEHALYEHAHHDLWWAKSQQWRVANWAVLAIAGVVGVARLLHPDPKTITPAATLPFIVVGGVIVLLAGWYLAHLHDDIVFLRLVYRQLEGNTGVQQLRGTLPQRANESTDTFRGKEIIIGMAVAIGLETVFGGLLLGANTAWSVGAGAVGFGFNVLVILASGHPKVLRPGQTIPEPAADLDDWLYRAAALPVRVFGLVAGGLAFTLTIGALAFFPEPGPGLIAGGGLGALAFGMINVYARIDARRIARVKAEANARLARRTIVDMANQSQGVLSAAWIKAIGTARTLDPVQGFLRELIDICAPLGGWRSEKAERAMQGFLAAADHINVLYSRIAKSDFSAEELVRRGRVLGGLAAASDALDDVVPVRADDPRISDKVRAHAEAIERWFGTLLDAPEAGA